jgi:hypothetical protein
MRYAIILAYFKNKERKVMDKRTDSEILKDLVEAVIEYDNLRDEEWHFDEENGDRDFWDEGTNDTHEKLLETILTAKTKVRNLLIEATNNNNISF